MDSSAGDFKELVRERTDIVSLIRETTSLEPRRGGQEFVGLCPFHDDHNPSFTVSTQRQTYKCWVCDEGGDCFSFIMKTDNVNFREAMELLAGRANLQVPTRRPGAQSQQPVDERTRLYDALKWAEDTFHKALLSSPLAEKARQYLADRDINQESIGAFRLGYHPNDWEWLLRQANGKFTPRQLMAARLVGERDSGSGYYDYFVDRVMFPIHDERGRPVAFGGRVLPGSSNADAPKYWNSPESSVFAKSKLLYGLDAARKGVRDHSAAVVVEGYTDCIVAHQFGLTNVLGTLGTALTEHHVMRLKRLARKVVLVYDGDEAGIAAAERALAKFLMHEVDLRVLTLPSGADPAELLCKEGEEAFRARIEAAPEAWEHKYATTLARHGCETIDGRHRLLEDMLELISQVPGFSGSAREDILLGRLSQRLGMPEHSVRTRLAELKRRARRGPGANRPSSPTVGSAKAGDSWSVAAFDKHQLLEFELLEIVFAVPELVGPLQERVPAEQIAFPPFREMLALCYQLFAQGLGISFQRISAVLEDPEQKRLALYIDEQAQAKDVAAKVRQEDRTAGENALPEYVREIVERLQWSMEERSHSSQKDQRAQQMDGSTGLDEDSRSVLRHATQFHQKRVNQKYTA